MADNITVVGNVASTPESGNTATGIETLSFRLASNSRRQDPKTGAWIDGDTNWFTVRAYRWLAENARASLSKGDSIIVHGRLKLRPWTTKEGEPRMAVEIEAENIGPDLRWGRSVFNKVSRHPAPEPSWATTVIPASDSGGSLDATVGALREEDEDRRVLVSVGAGDPPEKDGWSSAGDKETPF